MHRQDRLLLAGTFGAQVVLEQDLGCYLRLLHVRDNCNASRLFVSAFVLADGQ